MKTTAVQTEILAAVATLQLTPEQFWPLSDPEAEQIYRMALSRFVASRFEPRWWWEQLHEPQAGFQPDGVHAFDVIPQLVPDSNALIYFVPEDDDAPFYPVYRTTTTIAMSVLAECFGFEYYLFPPDFSWLVGENHHDVVFGTGEPIVSAIKTYSRAGESGFS